MAVETQFGTNINDLTNKITLITGASSGLGAAMAQAFVAAGAYVVNADITPDPPASYSTELPSSTLSILSILPRLTLLAQLSSRPTSLTQQASRLL